MTSGIRRARAASAARATFSPTTLPIEPPMNEKSMTQIATGWPPIVADAPHGGVAQAGRWPGPRRPGRDTALRSTKPSGSTRLQAGVALLERARVEEQVEARLGRQPEVVAAVRADPEDLLELLVEEHLLALTGTASTGRAGRRRGAGGSEGSLIGIRPAPPSWPARPWRPGSRGPCGWAGRLRRQATNAAPASEMAAEVSAPPIRSGRRGPSHGSRLDRLGSDQRWRHRARAKSGRLARRSGPWARSRRRPAAGRPDRHGQVGQPRARRSSKRNEGWTRTSPADSRSAADAQLRIESRRRRARPRPRARGRRGSISR